MLDKAFTFTVLLVLYIIMSIVGVGIVLTLIGWLADAAFDADFIFNIVFFGACLGFILTCIVFSNEYLD